MNVGRTVTHGSFKKQSAGVVHLPSQGGGSLSFHIVAWVATRGNAGKDRNKE